MLNKVLLIGHLVRDPEMRYTPSGIPVTTFRIAVNRPKNSKGESTADFIDIVAWRRLAEICGDYLKKGRLVAVEGRLRTRTYQTPDGQRRRVVEVEAINVHFLGKKSENTESISIEEPSEEILDIDIENEEEILNEILEESEEESNE
ncbi:MULTISPECIES: single-stranded DNA-binding protein [Dictyoglomus]|jgi:single-strand DNA-binding protein|uniref:Single-stranded DNA-binding protein n=1 Tax=Dictyoglomus turgidum (strain DSM 6724 / Z-1310) TaxID=515635 RepID=B8E0J1_DICTD|nr:MULTISPECIES: single-stranded DNA-binding protein [Dictyoglomus]ACK42636.1 single-strand binding protein [Dictyoglomus turgidum DSM 6724]PNV80518.1 MAG: single-stranded DNA-binding protein [Dictyoglomus turgidum]HBU31137.1 single-stranded DNA-binding protein [Dictyoglomus sp.]